MQLNQTAELVETAVAVPSEDFYSGGGFSNYWPTPDYQLSTLASYFQNSPPPYGNTVYGTPFYNGSGRGYPDVAALGQNILLYANGEPAFIGGTSASAPIFSSIITLINEHRLAAGKSTVGFLNPTLYQNPDAFNDVSLPSPSSLLSIPLTFTRSQRVETQDATPMALAQSAAGIQSRVWVRQISRSS